MKPPAESSPDATSAGSEDNPRAFAQATGLVFQSAGLVLLLGGCCVFSLSGLIQEPADQPIGSFREWVAVASVPQIVGALDVVFTFTAGAALLAMGIGLQGERVSAGRHALLVAAIFATGWWASLIAQVVFGGTWWQILISVALAALATVLFLMAGTSAQTLRRHPPIEDGTVSPGEFDRPTDAERVDQVLDEIDGTHGET